ncbi:MAG: hypothetical protein LBT09_03150 [Planctomycetaceae bacterium]|nr:hypothetical protein [Planctomycetaceae bacterium]
MKFKSTGFFLGCLLDAALPRLNGYKKQNVGKQSLAPLRFCVPPIRITHNTTQNIPLNPQPYASGICEKACFFPKKVVGSFFDQYPFELGLLKKSTGPLVV